MRASASSASSGTSSTWTASRTTRPSSPAVPEHVASHPYTGDQIRFLRAVQEVFLTKRRITEADLYEPPLTIFGRNAVEKFFTPVEIKEIVALTDHLAA